MTDDAPEKITRRKLSDQVLDRLQALITSGELKAGDTMPSERALMARFGVGRPAVREALQSLHNSGLITISHGERSRVNALDAGTVLSQSDAIARMLLTASPNNLQHLKEARQMFELGMVRLAAERATGADIAALRRMVEDQRRRLGDAKAFVEADMAFHARIAEISGNPIMAAVSRAMLDWLFEYHGGLLHWSGKEEVTLAEHARIVHLLTARDGTGAVAAMKQHLERSEGAFESRPA